MRVLVTGGTGFVGSHLIPFLQSRSFDIAVLSSSGRPANTGLDYHQVDLRNGNEVRRIVREFAPDHIYHLAGISTLADACADPRLTYTVNVLGACDLFDEAMRLSPAPRILNVSTSQVYAPSSRPLKEDSPLSPGSHYAASKAMAELLATQYRVSSTGGIITVRPFNHTGPGQSASFVLPSIAKQFAEIQSGRRQHTVSVGNIDVKRDFTDVRDVVRAYVALLEAGQAGETYNVCSGTCILLRDVLDKFQAVAGIKVNVETDPYKIRVNETPEVCGDASKLRAATGWFPTIPLEKTMRDLLNHWQASQNK